jgi:hypothetical protein
MPQTQKGLGHLFIISTAFLKSNSWLYSENSHRKVEIGRSLAYNAHHLRTTAPILRKLQPVSQQNRGYPKIGGYFHSAVLYFGACF